MMYDERDVPLNDFEASILTELLVAQSDFNASIGDEASSNLVPRGIPLPRRTLHVFSGAAAAAIVAAVAVGVMSRQPGTASAAPALPRPLTFGSWE